MSLLVLLALAACDTTPKVEPIVTEGNVGIQFYSGEWKEIKKFAKQEDKMIFVDCYTEWCGPCKMLAKDVFPLQEVGDTINKYFIGFKIDMEKGEGLTLKDEFEVAAFPTLVWANSKGEVLHKSVGFVKEAKLLKVTSDVIAGKGLISLQKTYEEDVTHFENMLQYIYALHSAYESDKIQDVLAAYYPTVAEDSMYTQDNFDLINFYMTNVEDPAFLFFDEHKEKYAEIFDAKKVNDKLYQTYLGYANAHFITRVSGQNVVDHDGFDAYKLLLEKRNVEGREKIIAFGQNNIDRSLGNWKAYVAGIIAADKLDYYGPANSFLYYNWGYALIGGKCTDKECMMQAADWMQTAFDNSPWPVENNGVYLEQKLVALEMAEVPAADLVELKAEIARIKALATASMAK